MLKSKNKGKNLKINKKIKTFYLQGEMTEVIADVLVLLFNLFRKLWGLTQFSFTSLPLHRS